MAIEMQEPEAEETVESQYVESTEQLDSPQYEEVEEKQVDKAAPVDPFDVERTKYRDIIETLLQRVEEMEAKAAAVASGMKVDAGGVKQVPDTRMTAPPEAPVGFVWVFNRGPEEFEWQHDSRHYKIAGHSFGLFPQMVAEHGKRRSLIALDTVTNSAVHQLVLPEDVRVYGVRLGSTKRVELIDRRTSDNPIGVTTDVPTRVAVVRVDGVREMLERRQDLFPEV